VAAVMVAAGIVAADTGAAAFTGVAATTVVMVAMDGAAGATDGAEEAGAGDLGTGGRIGGVMAGDIRMAITATTRGIMRHTLIRIRPTVTRRTISGTIRQIHRNTTTGGIPTTARTTTTRRTTTTGRIPTGRRSITIGTTRLRRQLRTHSRNPIRPIKTIRRDPGSHRRRQARST
jgi:hypothetical protein